MSALTDLDICNQALAILGLEPIDALDNETPNGQRCSLIYRPQVRDFLLSLHRWTFAARVAALAAVLPDAGDPLPYAYARPSDAVGQIHAYRTAADLNRPTEAASEIGDRIYSRVTPLWVEYTAAVPELRWPPAFQQLAVTLLASLLAFANDKATRGRELRDSALGSQFDQGVHGGMLVFAKQEDGKAAPARSFAGDFYDQGALIDARMGGTSYPWRNLGPFTGFDFIPPPED